MSSTAIILIAFYGLVAATLSFAWWRGGRAERAGVILLAAMAALSWAAASLTESHFRTVDLRSLILDFAGFAGFAWIGLRARRYWPLCAAALQLLSLGAHFARELKASVEPLAYALMKSGPTLMVCVVIAWGAANYRRRQQRALSKGCAGRGEQASWRRHSPG